MGGSGWGWGGLIGVLRGFGVLPPQEERSRSEHNLVNIQKTHERMQTENKSAILGPFRGILGLGEGFGGIWGNLGAFGGVGGDLGAGFRGLGAVWGQGLDLSHFGAT